MNDDASSPDDEDDDDAVAPIPLSAAERHAIAVLIDGTPHEASLLRQLAVVQVVSREWSGVGMSAHLSVPASAPTTPLRGSIDSPRLVLATIDGHDASVIAFCDGEGRLELLEVFTYGDNVVVTPGTTLTDVRIQPRDQ